MTRANLNFISGATATMSLIQQRLSEIVEDRGFRRARFVLGCIQVGCKFLRILTSLERSVGLQAMDQNLKGGCHGRRIGT